MNKSTRFGLFVLVALIQLYFPGRLVFDSNKVLWFGTELKLETAPVDPADPFRGRYVVLNFAASQFTDESGHDWKRHDRVYVLFEKDTEGYGKVKSLSASKPDSKILFVPARISYVSGKQITLYYPFTKFFMEENKAPEAERLYREEGKGYALLKVYRGEVVLEDVVVKGKSLKELTTHE